MLVARSKTDFVFIFFILGTFLVLKGGWGTPKVGRVEYSIRKLIGRCVGNLGNIVCTSNPNNGQGHQNAQGLAAMRNSARLFEHRVRLNLRVREKERGKTQKLGRTRTIARARVLRVLGVLSALCACRACVNNRE